MADVLPCDADLVHSCADVEVRTKSWRIRGSDWKTAVNKSVTATDELLKCRPFLALLERHLAFDNCLTMFENMRRMEAKLDTVSTYIIFHTHIMSSA